MCDAAAMTHLFARTYISEVLFAPSLNKFACLRRFVSGREWTHFVPRLAKLTRHHAPSLAVQGETGWREGKFPRAHMLITPSGTNYPEQKARAAPPDEPDARTLNLLHVLQP